MANRISLEETLLPALVQCFGIMFLGYILGKFEILGQREARGICKFTQYLALPALIFGTISTMQFTNVKWDFVASIFVSKVFIFVCVVLLTMLLTHPADLGKAGIYAIATTQSNDFALAYPMFMSLYKDSHPDYPSYLYIVAPIQLLVLNTIGFFIIETDKQKFDETTKCYLWKVLKGTLKNPIVFMTIVGIMWNLIFGNKTLLIFDTLLKTLSIAFPATALLLVGHTMASKSEKSDRHIPITVALLILTKNLILPIVMQKTSSFLLQRSSENEIQNLSSFGFLYGTTPTAPSVYVFATQYDVSVDVITKTIIGSTLLSAPLMFASASVISISQIGFENITFYLTLTVQYLSCTSLLCCSWLLLSFIIGKRFRNISFGVTLYIVFAQFITSLGGFLLFFALPKHSVLFYAQYVLSTGGIYATRICTLFLAILLLMIRWRSLCYILRIQKHINVISIFCLIIPISIAAFELLSTNIKSDGPTCQLGRIQIITTFTITLICFTGTVLCLILQHICFRNKCVPNIEESYSENVYQRAGENEHLMPHATNVKQKPLSNESLEDEITFDVEDLDKYFEHLSTDTENLFPNNIQDHLCDSRYYCSVEKRLQCSTRISTYQNEQRKTGLYEDKQIFQHTTLLITLSVSMTLSLTVCFWKIIMEKADGIFIELEFLDTIIGYSLGIVLLLIFGFNKGLIHTISNKWKALRCCKKNTESDVSSSEICHEFIRKHARAFRMDVKSLKTNHKDYFNVFCSSDLIQWLIENEAIKSADEAETYITSLQEGHIIETVDMCSFFPESEKIFRLSNVCS